MRRPEAQFSSPTVIQLAIKLGRAIRLARLARGSRRIDMAARARVSPSTLDRIERGDVAVSMSAWLSTLEAVSLLHLVEKPSDPDADPLGRAHRDFRLAKRAPSRRAQPGNTVNGQRGIKPRKRSRTTYDF